MKTREILPALSDAMTLTFSEAEKRALSRRANALRSDLSLAYSEMHPIAQLLSVERCFNSYGMKHAILAMWDAADERQRAVWVREAEYDVRTILWRQRNIPAFREMIRRVLRQDLTDWAGELARDDAPRLTPRFARTGLTEQPVTHAPHKPRPDYLRVVYAEAGGD